MDIAGALSVDHLKFLADGFWVTLYIAFISIVLSFIIGILFGTLRYAKIPVVSRVVAVLVETIRNMPLLLIIFFTFFALPEVGLKLSVTAAAITALTVFESAMLAEIVRGGLNSIDKGQIEAARSSGLTYIQTLRAYYHAASPSENGPSDRQPIYFVIEGHFLMRHYCLTGIHAQCPNHLCTKR